MLRLALAQFLLQRDDDALGVGAAAGADAQLGQLVTHGAVQGGEVLRDGALPARRLVASTRRGAGFLDLGGQRRGVTSQRKMRLDSALVQKC